MNFPAALHLHQSNSVPLEEHTMLPTGLIQFMAIGANMTLGFWHPCCISLVNSLSLSRMTVLHYSPISLAFFFLIRWLCLWSSSRIELPHPPIPHLLSYRVCPHRLAFSPVTNETHQLRSCKAEHTPALDSIYILTATQVLLYHPSLPSPHSQLPESFPLAAPTCRKFSLLKKDPSILHNIL